MKKVSPLFLSFLICTSLTLKSQAQTTIPAGRQISLLFGYTPVNAGSHIGHDIRLASSFRLNSGKIMWDFDVEYFASDHSWSRLVAASDGPLISDNHQETSGLAVGVAVSKMVRTISLGFGVSGHYFDIRQGLNDRVRTLETGEQVTGAGSTPIKNDKTFFSPGFFMQTDVGISLRENTQLYLKQRINWIYIGDHFQSSIWNSWLSYTVFAGIRFTI